MTARTIAKLAWSMPFLLVNDGGGSGEGSSAVAMERLPGLTDGVDGNASDVFFYANCFKNLHIGWDFAAAMAMSDEKFPSILHGDDLYVWRAYRFLKGESDPDVEGALAIETGLSSGRDTVRAMLVSAGCGHSEVSGYTSLRKGVVKAYEKLFFNVRDRLKDHMFMASVVYPEGRLVEAFEDYVESSGLGNLLLRAGYSKGVNHVLYASGLGNDHPYAAYNAFDGAGELDKMFMQDGVFIGSMGFMNQRRNSKAISNARMSLQANKMGGGEQSDGSVLADIGNIAIDELETLTQRKSYAMSGVPMVKE